MEIGVNGLGVNTNMMGLNNMKARRSKFGIGSLIILVVIGCVFVGFGLFLVQSSKINASWKEINGQVVSVNSSMSNRQTTYTPVVSYVVNGKAYQITSQTGSSSYPTIGSLIQVAYDPSQPQDAKVVSHGAVFVGYIFTVIGGLMVITAPVFFLMSRHRTKDIKDLKQTGQKVTGIITDVQAFNRGVNNNAFNNMNMMNSNNGSGEYRVIVSANDSTGQVKTYHSDKLNSIGALAMIDYRTNPIPIDVYIDPANPNNYYVDISELPNLSVDTIKQMVTQTAQNMHFQSISGSATPPISMPTITSDTPMQNFTPTNSQPSSTIPPVQPVNPNTDQPDPQNN